MCTTLDDLLLADREESIPGWRWAGVRGRYVFSAYSGAWLVVWEAEESTGAEHASKV